MPHTSRTVPPPGNPDRCTALHAPHCTALERTARHVSAAAVDGSPAGSRIRRRQIPDREAFGLCAAIACRSHQPLVDVRVVGAAGEDDMAGARRARHGVDVRRVPHVVVVQHDHSIPTARVTFLWGLGGDDSFVGREVESVRDPVVGEHVIHAEPVERCGQRPEVGRHEHPVGPFAEIGRIVHAVEAEGRQGDRDEQRGSSALPRRQSHARRAGPARARRCRGSAARRRSR